MCYDVNNVARRTTLDKFWQVLTRQSGADFFTPRFSFVSQILFNYKLQTGNNQI